jgi:hypothetical protein
VVAGHVEHRLPVEPLAGNEREPLADPLADVAGDDDGIVRRSRVGQRERPAPVHVDMQVGEDPEFHGEVVRG